MDGWFIEFDGEIVGELIEYRQEDMFWDSYRIVPKNELSEKIISQKELWDKCKFRFKNKRNSIYANGAFSSGQPKADGRVMMRGLYI
jgi:hypothetical protein